MTFRFIFFSSVFFTLLVFANGKALSAPAERSYGTALPEFFLAHLDKSCQIKVELPKATDIRTRRDNIMRFMDAAYPETNDWKIMFGVGGVDFDSFDYFNLVLFSSCEAPPNLKSNLARTFGKYALSIQKQNTIAGSGAAVSMYPNVWTMLQHFDPHYPIGKCLITLDVADPNKELEAYLLSKSVSRKYGIPFFDVSWKNDKIYLLIGKNCEWKRSMLDYFFAAISRTGTPPNSLFSGWSLNANSQPYENSLAR